MKKLAFVLFVFAAHDLAAQVSLQSGRATFSLPIFNWQDNKSKLTDQTVLYYNSGNGLKINDIASNIGQGWDLAIGGVISRIQVGQPDDQEGRDGPYYDFTKYPNGYLYNTKNIADGCPVAIGDFPIFTTRNVQYKQHNTVEDDRELDYFSFEFNGRQGKFILTKNGTDQCISLGDSKLKIWFERDPTMSSQGIRTTISAFYIQDENGILYKFRQKAIYKVLQVKYTDDAGNPITSTPTADPDQRYMESYFDDLSLSENPYVVNGWYLSEVEDLLTHRIVTYAYTSSNIFTETGKTITYTWGNEKQAVISINKSKSTQPRITEVNYPDGHKVQLLYGINRVDLNGDAVLDAITVHFQNSFLTKYQFTTSYFIKNIIGSPSTDDEKKSARLCLTSVKKYDTKEWDHDTYSFDYYLGTNSTEDFVPLPFMYSRDLWGYYNGDYSGVPLNNSPKDFSQCGKLAFVHTYSPIVTPKLGYAKNGLLKSITYPTGSTLTYEYEQNKFTDNTQTDVYIGGVHVSKTVLSDGTSNSTSDIVTSYRYIMSDGKSSLWGYEPPVNALSKPVFFRAETPFAIFGFPPCDYRYKYPGLMDRKSESTNPGIVGKVVTWKLMRNLYLACAFLEYYLAGDRDFKGLVSAVIADDMDRTGGIDLSCPSDTGRTIANSIYKNFDILSINPLPLQFKRVEVKVGGPQANKGATVHEFTSDADYPVIVANNSSSYSMKQRYAEWAYGLPKSVTVLDEASNPVKQTLYTYDWSKAVTALTSSTSCKCYTPKLSSRGDDSWNTTAYANTFTNTSTDFVTVDPYTLFTGHIELFETNERHFKDASNYLETKTKYEYNPNNLLVKKVEQILSNQDKVINETFYTVDYTTPGVIQTLKNNNIIGLPVANYKSVIKYQSVNPTYLNAEVTEFASIANGDIRPHRIYVGRSATPISAFTFNPADPFNYPGLKEIRQNIYDNSSDLVKVKNEGNRITSKILDYSGRFTTAIATNANPDEIAYTSFETSNTGNWTIQGGEYRDDLYNAPTGKKVYYLNTNDPTNSPITRTGLNFSNTYVVSYWTKEGSPLVNGLAEQPVFSVNGWSLYIHEIAGANTISITGEAIIDELRLYPRNASMVTFTYDVVFGKTAECDANNRICYFSYSPFGELILIQDQGRNALKAFEYRYRNRTRKSINIH
jgi:hypothetical protein